jgi:hypothetical protein
MGMEHIEGQGFRPFNDLLRQRLEDSRERYLNERSADTKAEYLKALKTFTDSALGVKGKVQGVE